jgi:hypothetical protein
VKRGLLSPPRGAVPFSPGPLPGWDAVFDTMGTPRFVTGASFPADGWDPAIEVDRIAMEFAAGETLREGGPADPGPPPGHVPEGASRAERQAAQAALAADVEALLVLKQQTIDAGRRAEIAYQVGSVVPYFMKLATCSASVRRETQFLLELCLRVGALAARRFKRQYMRARPVQVIPSIDTVVVTPRHPSYPSGHGLQAHLLAAAVAEVAPALGARAQVLAARIALNRELAGVHFRSDSAASERLAAAVWAGLAAMPEVRARVRLARAEHSGSEARLPRDAIARIEAPDEDDERGPGFRRKA